MRTWMVVTEIFLLGLWVDDWGLGVAGATAGFPSAVRDLQSHQTTHLQSNQTRLIDSSIDSVGQAWTDPVRIRPPPGRE